MDTYRQKVDAAAELVRQHMTSPPRIGFLAGTGLGASTAGLEVATALDYEQIPHFPASTVCGHQGRLLTGTLAGLPAIAMQGRLHLYEGYSPREVTFPIRLLQALGVDVLMISNAAGGIDPGFQTGDIMVIADHLNLTGANPLAGPENPHWGVRFPDMGRAYDAELRATAHTQAQRRGLDLQTGVYAGLLGPSLETPAEIRYLQAIGAHAVGFSTVHEVIVGIQAGMRILGFSIITNVHDPSAPQPATLEEIIAVADNSTPRLQQLITDVAALLAIEKSSA